MKKSVAKIGLFEVNKPGGMYDFSSSTYSIDLYSEAVKSGKKKKFLTGVEHNDFFMSGDGNEAKTLYPHLNFRKALLALLLNKTFKKCGIQEGEIVWIKGFPLNELAWKPKFAWERYRIFSLDGNKIKVIKGRRAEWPMLLKARK